MVNRNKVEIKMEKCVTQTVLDHVKECQEMFDHQSDEYYIKRYLHDGLEEIANYIPTEGDMIFVGLIDSHARDFCIFLRDYKYVNYQSIEYWLDFYLECVKNRSKSGTTKTVFPFEDDIVDEWFLQKYDDKQVYIKNARFYTKIKSIVVGANFLLAKEANWWYHGTSHESALSLLKHGIVPGMGNKGQDFSTGHAFHLSRCFQTSIKYAKRNMIEKKGAVLIYYGELDSFIGLDLFNNKEEWKRVIKYNRSGGIIRLTGDLNDRFNASDYIIGNMSSDRCKYDDGDPDWCPIQEKDTYQLCIKSDKMSDEFILERIVFFSD